jgi:hypothetical protein
MDGIEFLKSKGWNVKKYTIKQSFDDGEFSSKPDWGEGVWESFICTKDKKLACLVIVPDSSGSYDNVFGPSAEELVRSLQEWYKYYQEHVEE